MKNRNVFLKTSLMLLALVFSLSLIVSCGGEDYDVFQTPECDEGMVYIPERDACLYPPNPPNPPNPPTPPKPECDDGLIYIEELEMCAEPPAYDLTGEWEDRYETVNVEMDEYIAWGFEPQPALYVTGFDLFFYAENGYTIGSISEDGTTVNLEVYTKRFDGFSYVTFTRK